MLPIVVAAITTILSLAGLGYYLLALWSARAFQRQLRRPLPDFQPGVSILKPVKGLDPEMYASFASHCLQQYQGPYEILFGVSSMADPAVAAIERLTAEFPQRTIRLVLCPQLLGANGKVSNLVQMLGSAQYDHILINDSDIKVSPYYLRRIMGCFHLPKRRGGRVGLVTALYRGQAHSTIGSRMEALGIATDFIAGVLTARQIEDGIRFGLGSTLAVSRQALEAIGGLEPLVDYLADDYELGARIWRSGFEVVLSGEVVETFLPRVSLPSVSGPPDSLEPQHPFFQKAGLHRYGLHLRIALGLMQPDRLGRQPQQYCAAQPDLVGPGGASLGGRRGCAGRSPGTARSVAAGAARRGGAGHLDLELRGKHRGLAWPAFLLERRQDEPAHGGLGFFPGHPG